MPTASALEPQATRFEPSTIEVVLELAHHELRQPSVFLHPLAEPGIVILTSSRAGEKSLATSPSGLSLMTHFLEQGLRGDPNALDKSSRLTAHSLHDYLCQEVTHEGKKRQHKQLPTLDGATEGTAYLADFSEETRNPNELDFDAVDARRVIFVDYDYPDPSDIATIARNARGQAPSFLLKLAERDIGRLVQMHLKQGIAAYKNSYPKLEPTKHEEAEVEFEDGKICATPMLVNDRVRIEYAVHLLDSSWWSTTGQPQDLLTILGLAPKVIRMEHQKLNPDLIAKELASAGWKYRAGSGDDEIEMTLGTCSVHIRPYEVDYSFGDVLEILRDRTCAKAIDLAKAMTTAYRVLRQHKALQ